MKKYEEIKHTLGNDVSGKRAWLNPVKTGKVTTMQENHAETINGQFEVSGIKWQLIEDQEAAIGDKVGEIAAAGIDAFPGAGITGEDVGKVITAHFKSEPPVTVTSEVQTSVASRGYPLDQGGKAEIKPEVAGDHVYDNIANDEQIDSDDVQETVKSEKSEEDELHADGAIAKDEALTDPRLEEKDNSEGPALPL